MKKNTIIKVNKPMTEHELNSACLGRELVCIIRWDGYLYYHFRDFYNAK